jgi:hypothetical protein
MVRLEFHIVEFEIEIAVETRKGKQHNKKSKQNIKTNTFTHSIHGMESSIAFFKAMSSSKPVERTKFN